MLYSRIIVGIDLSSACENVVERAAKLASLCDAELHIAHIIEPLSFAYGGELPVDFSGLDEEIATQARTKVANISEHWQIPMHKQHIVTGRPDKELQHIAEQISADLIVVGTHGRQGFALLLGSTSNGVLHGCPCDVLAIKV